MGFGLTNEQRLENYRIRYEITHNRIKELASYIRITDAAIWGFLAFVFVEFFKDGYEYLLFKIPLYSLLVIISMILWRQVVQRYQDDIVDGYELIKDCEINLQLVDNFSLSPVNKWNLWGKTIEESHDISTPNIKS